MIFSTSLRIMFHLALGICNSVWAKISYPFCNLSKLGWQWGNLHAQTLELKNRHAWLTYPTPKQPWTSTALPSMFRHIMACRYFCNEGEWSVASAVPAETCECECRSPLKNAWIKVDPQSIKLSNLVSVQQVLDFILLSREDHWSLAQEIEPSLDVM